jgi:hypothetical protein
MKAEVTATTDQIEFTTKTNGVRLLIKQVHFGQDEAGKLAQLINSGQDLKIVIKDSIG